jgi:hypothetical protein
MIRKNMCCVFDWLYLFVYNLNKRECHILKKIQCNVEPDPKQVSPRQVISRVILQVISQVISQVTSQEISFPPPAGRLIIVS